MGRRADAMLAASPTVGPYVRTRIQTGTMVRRRPVPERSAGHLHFYDTARSRRVLNHLSRTTTPA
jgi:hypothetical protein